MIYIMNRKTGQYLKDAEGTQWTAQVNEARTFEDAGEACDIIFALAEDYPISVTDK
jgi:hypothetical protein